MTRHLIGGLLFSLVVSGTADAASIVVVARKPDLACPKTELGDAAPQPTPVPPPQPTPKPKPEPKPDARPASGKYRLVFNDGARSGFLLELQDDILWIHGDINPAKPNGISVWPSPRAVPCRFIGTKVLTDDGDPSTNKWRCAITWDTKTNEVSYLYDNYKGTRQQKQGRITAGAW